MSTNICIAYSTSLRQQALQNNQSPKFWCDKMKTHTHIRIRTFILWLVTEGRRSEFLHIAHINEWFERHYRGRKKHLYYDMPVSVWNAFCSYGVHESNKELLRSFNSGHLEQSPPFLRQFVILKSAKDYRLLSLQFILVHEADRWMKKVKQP